MRQKNLSSLFKRAPLLLLCASLLLSACGRAEQTGTTDSATTNNAAPSPAAQAQATPAANTQPQEVTATVEEAKLDAGGAGEATVSLEVAEGYHVHANPASDRFYVATEIRAEPQEGITPGKPVYPQALSKKFSFSDKPLAVYEGRVVIKLPLRADKDAAKGHHTLRAKIRVQPCNDQACKPPRDIDAPIPVTVN
ncbi:MAG: hypothetical protein QOJ70_3720 [Acidobacteriota bacterium]|jgi:hypothetical protein|nr:hypothetical protein [Acidobacteriota bacterium]MDT7809907.1 hypothetical protein [Acidobacteriota bacterium]